MTTVYFVRHAQPDFTVRDDAVRPLTAKGLKDRGLVTEYLKDKDISVILSSPYKRAYDTLAEFSEKSNLAIQVVDGFRERSVDNVWIDDFVAFSKNQWKDFSYRYSDGECLEEVQERNIQVLNEALQNYSNQNIAIGSHGTALSTIINYYDKSFGYEEFETIKSFMPWIVKFTFDGTTCKAIERIDLFAQ